MTPYSRTDIVETSVPGEVVEIPCPGRCYIDNVRFASVNTGLAFDVDLYSRSFVGPLSSITKIVDDARGKCMFVLPNYFAVKLGDVVAVTGAANPEYNMGHRVTKIISDKQFVTDVDFVGYEPGEGGAKVQLSIPPAEWETYRVGAKQTAENGVSAFAEPLAVPFVNQDPQGNVNNRGYPHKLYAHVGAPGMFQVTITLHAGITR